MGAMGWIVRGVLAAVMLAAMAFAVDYAVGYGKTAHGVRIAEFELGNLTDAQARHELSKLSVVSHGRITLRTSSGTAKIDPAELGARFDVDATMERLKEQPKNPVTRLAGMLGIKRDVAPVVRIDRSSFDEALDDEKKTLEKAAVEGGVHFRGTEAVGDFPKKGMRVDRDKARVAVEDNWLAGGPIDLAMEPFAPSVSHEVVQQTLDGDAQNVTASALTLDGRGDDLRVSPHDLGRLVSYVPDGKGGLKPHVKSKEAKKVLGDRTAPTESEPVNATFEFSGGSPTVVPAQVGARVDWKKAAELIAETAPRDGERTGKLPYTLKRPEVTTKRAHQLGVKEVVSEFTTGDFSGPSGTNIRIVADTVDGAVVLPGETFSLNGYTGHRGTPQGYVDSGIIDHGRPAKAVGGGISQFATTLYNAAYFAGLEDVDHTEHNYYISRYPEAREATVFEGAIDLAFRNNTDYGVYIETLWSPSSVTVRMWSTKTRDVESVTGSRSNQTQPEKMTLPEGDNCVPSSGGPGFTSSDTRIISDHRTGAEISRHTRNVEYDPQPVVNCK